MTVEGLWRMRWTQLLWVVSLIAASGPTASPARANDERILTMAKDAVYGGATGLLLGGVLTLVVSSENRDDVVRWGVVVGTFAGFGYGLYEALGTKDGFTERVRARADARLQARLERRNEAAIASARSDAAPGGSARSNRGTAVRPPGIPWRGTIEDRPEPERGGATGRTSW
jgi:hypothetical protein